MNLLYVLICLEIFEYLWQKGETLQEYLQALYARYQKGVILFACMHPSFIFMLFCIFALHINSPIIIFIAAIKCMDIVLKISLLQKIDTNQNDLILTNILKQNPPLSTLVKILPMIIYSILFYIGAFST